MSRATPQWDAAYRALSAMKLDDADVLEQFGNSSVHRTSADGFYVERTGNKLLGLYTAADVLAKRANRKSFVTQRNI